jgi:N-acetylglucosaminyl-diphospho-decaprenol L-rhamnosyltransferase
MDHGHASREGGSDARQILFPGRILSNPILPFRVRHPGAARVSAVIVHFRTPDETVQSVSAVAAAAPDAELLVLDNASGDSIRERLSIEARSARVVLESENRGYGPACNRGARETSREFLLFLNSDAMIRPGAVEALVAALDSDPRAAVVGPRLENSDGSLQPSILRLPTLGRVFCESSGLAHLSGGRAPLRGHSATREDHSRPHPVECVKGAALLVRRSAFEEVGGFDERFFLYAEESDLCARLSRRGWKILFEPAARVVHRGGASGGDALFGQVNDSLSAYVARHQGKVAAAAARMVLTAGAAGRYLLSLVTPGERGRIRRSRYRAALAGPPRRA